MPSDSVEYKLAADVAGAFRVVGEDEVQAGVGQWAGNLNS